MVLEKNIYGKDMENRLLKRFYTSFWLILIVMSITVTTFLILSIITWIKFVNNKSNVTVAVISTVMLVIFFVLSIKEIIPHFKDLKCVKKRQFGKMVGTVIKYRKKISGGEPPSTDYYPIFRELNSDREIELNVEGTKINQTYILIYLKHTKIAVIEDSNRLES